MKIRTKHLFLLTLLFLISYSLAGPTEYKNGKFNMLVAISSDIKEDTNLIKKIENEMAAASKYLWEATKGQHQFGEVTILVPHHWTDSPEYEEINETEKDADIVILKGSGSAYATGGKIYLYADNLKGRGRTAVHEFGHAIYGLGDEYCMYFPGGRAFYIEPGGWIKCTEKVTWKTFPSVINSIFDTYIPIASNSNGEKASIMWNPHEESIVDFCDSSNHNKSVSSEQNLRYSYKDCISIIEKNAKTPSGKLRYEFKFAGGTKYEFELPKIRKAKALNFGRVILVIDRSGSMYGWPLETAKNAASKFVQEIKDGNLLGVVQFDDKAQIVQDLTKVQFFTKYSIRSAIKSISSGGTTSIGAGLLVAKSMIENSKERGYRNIIIVLTDGEENTPPWIKDVTPQIIASRITVYGIAIGNVGSTIKTLRDLCNSTGGKLSAVLDWTWISQSFNQIYSEVNPEGVILSNFMISINPSETLKKDIFIDSSISSDLKFSLDSLDISNLEFNLIDPMGRNFGPAYSGYFTNSGYKIYSINDADIRYGTWSMVIRNSSNSKINATLNVKAESSLKVFASVEEQEVVFPNPIHIKAQAEKNGLCVLNLNAMAEIITPKGVKKYITLHDDGVNGDSRPQDGSYEALFYDYDSDGNYTINISFNNDKREALVGTPLVADFGPEDGIDIISKRLEENISRQVESPSVTLTGFRKTKIGPGKIGPLMPYSVEVIGTIKFDQKIIPRYLVILQWAAPGNSGYVGKAAKYEMKYSFEWLTEENFSLGRTVEGLPQPEEPGTFQTVKIFDLLPGKYYFAIRALDESGTAGPISNNVIIELSPYIKNK